MNLNYLPSTYSSRARAGYQDTCLLRKKELA
jgi:hypothetical protein